MTLKFIHQILPTKYDWEYFHISIRSVAVHFYHHSSGTFECYPTNVRIIYREGSPTFTGLTLPQLKDSAAGYFTEAGAWLPLTLVALAELERRGLMPTGVPAVSDFLLNDAALKSRRVRSIMSSDNFIVKILRVKVELLTVLEGVIVKGRRQHRSDDTPIQQLTEATVMKRLEPWYATFFSYKLALVEEPEIQSFLRYQLVVNFSRAIAAFCAFLKINVLVVNDSLLLSTDRKSVVYAWILSIEREEFLRRSPVLLFNGLIARIFSAWKADFDACDHQNLLHILEAKEISWPICFNGSARLLIAIIKKLVASRVIVVKDLRKYIIRNFSVRNNYGGETQLKNSTVKKNLSASYRVQHPVTTVLNAER